MKYAIIKNPDGTKRLKKVKGAPPKKMEDKDIVEEALSEKLKKEHKC